MNIGEIVRMRGEAEQHLQKKYRGLTKRQKQLIRVLSDTQGRPWTLGPLARATGYSSDASVYTTLKGLIERGAVEKEVEGGVTGSYYYVTDEYLPKGRPVSVPSFKDSSSSFMAEEEVKPESLVPKKNETLFTNNMEQIFRDYVWENDTSQEQRNVLRSVIEWASRR